ncbi:kinase family with ARM repeat domain-containing protein [Actinidia rufa]|uniref:Kinase family with ARM repeat domain-containing protein n=1 Tax=Actinidia rufa TaxID=165716 RepID=A0A7J0FA81_9ERIC|nr:kinase family with ARM repeat domain-containing protein [Actinidia rufa]
MLDKHCVLEILQTIQRCIAVDRSAPTLMCTLGVANSILKQYGLEFTAEHVLPLIAPLLISQQLTVQQFAKYMLFVKDILRTSEESYCNCVPSTSRNNPSWDDDWVPTLEVSQSTLSSAQPAMSNQPPQVTSTNLQSSINAASNQQTALSCPPVELEWPPRSSSGVTPHLGDIEKQNQNSGLSTASFDDIDPFANWPLPPNATSRTESSDNGTFASSADIYGSSLSTSTPNGLNFQTASSNYWASNTANSIEPLRPNQGSTGSFNSGPHNQNSIGLLKQNQGISVMGTYTDKKPTDLGSIFVSSKNEQTAPRLAPPPPTAVGRGRGRGRGNQGQTGAASAMRSSHAKSSAEQPPLLDLM